MGKTEQQGRTYLWEVSIRRHGVPRQGDRSWAGGSLGWTRIPFRKSGAAVVLVACCYGNQK